MSKGAVDLRISNQDVFEDGQAFRPVEISSLASNDLYTGALLAHVIIETLTAITRRRCPCDTFQLNDLASAFQYLTQVFSSDSSTCHIIGSDMRDNRSATGCPVDCKDRDTSIISFLDRWHNRFGIRGVDQQS